MLVDKQSKTYINGINKKSDTKQHLTVWMSHNSDNY